MSINFYTDADGVTLSVKNNWVEALPLLYESLIQLSIFKKCVLRKKLNIEKSLKEWGKLSKNNYSIILKRVRHFF